MGRHSSLRAFSAGLLCVVVFLEAQAGVNQWTIKGPPGGYFRDMEASTTDGSVFYAAYSRSFHRSIDGGVTWVARDFTGEVVDIAVDPADGNRIFVAVLDEGLFRSTDAGRTFTEIAPAWHGIWASGVGPGNVVYYASSVGFHRSTDGGDSFSVQAPMPQTVERILVVGTDANSIYALRGRFLMRSVDGGANWSESSVGGPSSWLYSIVRLTNGTLALATSDGLYTSTDGGVTWSIRRSGLHWSVAVDPSASDTLIAAGNELSPLIRSTDGGTSWSFLGTAPRGPVRRALISRDSSSRLVVANNQGVQRSLDGGATWTDATRGPVSSDGYSMATTVAANSRVYVFTGWSASLFSMENDSDWERLGESLEPLQLGQARVAVKPGSPRSVFLAAHARGVFRSVDGGHAWSYPGPELNNFVVNAIAFDPVNATTMYATVVFGGSTPPASFYRSTDGGASWSPRSVDLGSVRAYRIAVDPVDGNRIFLAGNQEFSADDIGGLYLSTNAGVNWSRIAFAGQDVRDVAVDPGNSNRVYAATSTGLQVSTDGGVSFVPNDSFATITGSQAWEIEIDPMIPTTIYAVSLDPQLCCTQQTSSFVLRSVDAGQSWETLRAQSQSPTWFVDNLVLDPNTPSRIYVGTGARGIAAFEIVNDLEVTISGHSGRRAVGAASSFNLRAQHHGALAATGVKLVTDLPAGLTNVSATTDRGTCAVSGTTLTCTVPVLRPSQVVNVDVSYTPPTAILLAVKTTLSAHERDDATENNSVEASAIAGEVVDLGVVITPSAATVVRGDGLTYSVQVSNAGPLSASSGTLTFAPGNGLSLGATPAGCALTGGMLTCSLAVLAIGTTQSFEFAATAAIAGSLTATATVAPAPTVGDASPANNSSVATVTSRPIADISVSITDTADPVTAGAGFSYQITVRNGGPDEVTDVTATVEIPGTVSISSSTHGTCASNAGAFQCTIGALTSGSTAIITITTSSNNVGAITARATAASTSDDRVAGNNSAEQTTTINAKPSGGGSGGSGGGGGGTISPASMLVGLLLLALMRRIRPSRSQYSRGA